MTQALNMKNAIIILLISLIICSNPANAMEEISTTDGRNLIGYITEENEELISIRDENGIDTEIPLNLISGRKVVYADIFTTTGGKYVATLSEATNSYFTFRMANEYEFRIDKQYFDHLTIQTSSPDISNWSTWRNEPKPLGVPEKYSCLGVELGMPGIINGSITLYDTYYTGYKITAGIFPPKIWGCELSMLFTILNSKSLISNLYASTGLYSNKNLDKDGKMYWYLGGGADLNYHNLFIKIGISTGFNYESGSHITLPLVSAGYVYRFSR